MNEIVVVVTGNGEGGRKGRWGGLTIVEWQPNERMTKSANGRRDDGHLEKRTSTERIVQNVVYCHTMIMRYSRISKLSSATQRPSWDGAIRLVCVYMVYVRAKVREWSLLFHAILLLHHSFRFAIFFRLFVFHSFECTLQWTECISCSIHSYFSRPFNCFIAYEQRQCNVRAMRSRRSSKGQVNAQTFIANDECVYVLWRWCSQPCLAFIATHCTIVSLPHSTPSTRQMIYSIPSPDANFAHSPFAHKCIWYVLWSDEVIKIQYFSACIRPTVCARPMSIRWPLRN